MNKFVLLFSVIYLNGCSNHKILNIDVNNNPLLENQTMCYLFSDALRDSNKIFNKKYLEKKRQSSDFYIQYEPQKLMQNIIDLRENCSSNNNIYINDMHIFKKNYSDTAQWKELYFIAVDISSQDNNYILGIQSFKDYESTGWVNVFNFKNRNKIIINAIERALIRIFTDIENSITYKMTLQQRNSSKDNDRLETEKAMDKYIETLKSLERNN